MLILETGLLAVIATLRSLTKGLGTLSIIACFKRALYTMVFILIFHSSNTLDSEMTFLFKFNLHSVF